MTQEEAEKEKPTIDRYIEAIHNKNWTEAFEIGEQFYERVANISKIENVYNIRYSYEITDPPDAQMEHYLNLDAVQTALHTFQTHYTSCEDSPVYDVFLFYFNILLFYFLFFILFF